MKFYENNMINHKRCVFILLLFVVAFCVLILPSCQSTTEKETEDFVQSGETIERLLRLNFKRTGHPDYLKLLEDYAHENPERIEEDYTIALLIHLQILHVYKDQLNIDVDEFIINNPSVVLEVFQDLIKSYRIVQEKELFLRGSMLQEGPQIRWMVDRIKPYLIKLWNKKSEIRPEIGKSIDIYFEPYWDIDYHDEKTIPDQVLENIRHLREINQHNRFGFLSMRKLVEELEGAGIKDHISPETMKVIDYYKEIDRILKEEDSGN